MTELTYPELIRELFPRLSGGVRWGLERTERLLAAVGDPHRSFRCVHVGGTNGKGSVAASVAAVLAASGARAGLYTSPHLCTFRERMQVAGAPLAEEAILAAARRLWPSIQATGATFFEATTAIAFLAMADAGVEWGVVEVGLGGRLDATNVVRPEVVALTNVALDHAEFLGDTVAAIAAEKAGILKAGVPAVTAEEADDALAVFRRRAAAVSAPLHALDRDRLGPVSWERGGTTFALQTRSWGALELWTPLIGAHQALNAALAVAALEMLPERDVPETAAVRDGLARVRWPGRIQVEEIGGGTWVFDAAHNPAAASALTAAVSGIDLPRPLVLLAGILQDKDWPAMLPPLRGLADATVLTVPATAPEHRRWDPHAAAAADAGYAEVVPDFGAAVQRAWELAGGTGAAGVGAGPGPKAGSIRSAGTVLVTGSLHTVGDALVALGRGPADQWTGVAGTESPAETADSPEPSPSGYAASGSAGIPP